MERTVSGSPPVVGYFDLLFNDSEVHILNDISHDVSTLDLKNRLESLELTNEVTVRRYGTCHG